ncbi:hypothetical protein BJX96DRAFT_185663 [Aspergillus floccosus]
MEHALNLQLSIPEIHHTSVTSQGDSYSLPIAGVARIFPPCAESSDDLRVNVSLIRIITSGHPSPTTPCSSKYSLQRFKRHASTRSRGDDISQPDKHTSIETVVHCNLFHTPHRLSQYDGRLAHEFAFSLPIPDDIPSTTYTRLGSVSYMMRASATTALGTTVDTTQQIQIVRRVAFSYSEPVISIRHYRNSEMTTRLHLTPELPQDPTIQMSYRARLVAEQMMAHGPRKTEVRQIVVKDLQWQVQERVRVLEVPSCGMLRRSEVRCKAQHVHELCGGNLGASHVGKGSLEQESKDDHIDFNFDINIPKDTAVSGALNLSSYSNGSGWRWTHQRDCEVNCPLQRTVITVDHQLKLDIITGEDTFDTVTGKLVDRKPLFKSFSAFFPIPVHETGGENGSGDVFELNGEALPKYEDASMMPPLYEPTG